MESLIPVVNYILEGEFPKEFTTGQRRKLIKQASMFLWLEGALYQKGKDLVCRRVPSTNEIPKILKGLHEEACGGHFSHELTLKKVLLAGYVWPSMHADVQHWCRSCHNCQVNGNKKLLYGPRQAVIANGPFEKWGIDAMGPLPRTANGKLYILVAIDYMTRWVEAQSVAKVNEKTVSKFVYTHICCRFGTPLEIVSDNGPGFRRGLLTEVCEVLKISHRHSTPYYPQSNGLVEKANGIIAGIIRKMVESKPKHWDNFLDGAIWTYRTTYRDATQFTPFHLVYGQESLQPIELNIPTIKLTGRQEQSNDEAWIDRLLNLVELEWKREAAYHCYEKKALQLKDKLNEGIKDKQIKEKSLVLRYNNALDNRFDAKFERRWEGPFIVKKAFTGGYYQLMDLNGKEHPRKVNGYRLKPYLSRILPAVFETKQVSKKTKKEEFDAMYASKISHCSSHTSWEWSDAFEKKFEDAMHQMEAHFTRAQPDSQHLFVLANLRQLQGEIGDAQCRYAGLGSIRKFLGSLTCISIMDAQAALGGVRLCICNFSTNTRPDTCVDGVPSWNTYTDNLVEAAFTMAYDFMVADGVVIALRTLEQYIPIVWEAQDGGFQLIRTMYLHIHTPMFILRKEYTKPMQNLLLAMFVCGRDIGWLLGTFTEMGDVVMDMFADTKRVASQCLTLRRHCINIEVDRPLACTCLAPLQRVLNDLLFGLFFGEVFRTLQRQQAVTQECKFYDASSSQAHMCPLTMRPPISTMSPEGSTISLWSSFGVPYP
ncbi:hypothetical protein L7F22_026480 [Adiantum nelumboides]|nr:hypothetical protein [Adiantum nelumboides]